MPPRHSLESFLFHNGFVSLLLSRDAASRSDGLCGPIEPPAGELTAILAGLGLFRSIVAFPDASFWLVSARDGCEAIEPGVRSPCRKDRTSSIRHETSSGPSLSMRGVKASGIHATYAGSGGINPQFCRPD